MTWDQWSEGIADACPACRGVGVFDSGDKGHGACTVCGGSGEAPEEVHEEGPGEAPEEDSGP